MKTLGNLALISITIAVLAVLAVEALSFWESLSYRPQVAEEPPHEQQLYSGLEPEEIGEIVLKSQGCLACHSLDLQGGVLGPSLDNVGVRRAEDWLREKILKPHMSVPGTYMPPFHLGEEELEGLVAFLRTLTPGRSSPANTGTAKIEIPTDEQGRPRFTLEQIERGEELYRTQGCVGCHTINGLIEGGVLGPNLTHEAQRRRSDEWQLKHLIDPLSVYVVGETEGIRWPMPAYGRLSQEELEALVAFLQSLK
jgi:mono/diheme cytochrome c family protein